MTFDDIRQIAHKFTGMTDSTSYNTPSLKVRNKMLARVSDDADDVLVMKVPDIQFRDVILSNEPDNYYITPHYQNYPYVLVRLNNIKPDDVEDLIERTWRTLASKTQIKQHDDSLNKTNR